MGFSLYEWGWARPEKGKGRKKQYFSYTAVCAEVEKAPLQALCIFNRRKSIIGLFTFHIVQ